MMTKAELTELLRFYDPSYQENKIKDN